MTWTRDDDWQDEVIDGVIVRMPVLHVCWKDFDHGGEHVCGHCGDTEL